MRDANLDQTPTEGEAPLHIARCWLIASLTLTAAPAAAAQPDAPPTWAHKPSASDLLSVWPRTALARRGGGEAALRCQVSDRGALLDCAILTESPDGAGFGAAAKALAPRFRMKPATHDGQPTASSVSFAIRFPEPDALDPSTGSLLSGGAGGAHVELYDPPPGGFATDLGP